MHTHSVGVGTGDDGDGDDDKTETVGLGLELRLAAVWAGAPRTARQTWAAAKPRTLEVRLCALAHYVTRTRPGRAFLSLAAICIIKVLFTTVPYRIIQS